MNTTRAAVRQRFGARFVRRLGALAAPGAAVALALAVTASAALPRDRRTVRLAGGTFLEGHDDAERADEGPAHVATVGPFELDATLVTRADFSRFVARTGYRTTAEALGYGMVAEEGMIDWEWQHAGGASWRRPFLHETKDTAAFLADDAPVVMVSWDDAVAYCAGEGKRLPTEAEWDYAMRAGASGTRYPWGDDPYREGKLGLNFWQGASHEENRRDDGFVYVSPVRAFAPNAWGIYDAVGNVWQWTADAYAPDAHERAGAADGSGGPAGREVGAVSHEGRRDKRVLRGGSWWCGACTCEGNGLYYRGKADRKAPFNNNGFRCARSLT